MKDLGTEPKDMSVGVVPTVESMAIQAMDAPAIHVVAPTPQASPQRVDDLQREAEEEALLAHDPSAPASDRTNAAEVIDEDAILADDDEEKPDEARTPPAATTVVTDITMKDAATEAKGEPSKAPAGEAASAMDVADPDAPPTLDLRIIQVRPEDDWDELAEVQAARAGLDQDLPVIQPDDFVFSDGIFFSGERRCWVVQTADYRFVSMNPFSMERAMRGKVMATRCARWLDITTRHPGLGASFKVDKEYLEPALKAMIAEYPEGATEVEGAKNGLGYWIDVEKNKAKQRRHADQVEDEKKKRAELEEQRKNRLTGRTRRLRRMRTRPRTAFPGTSSRSLPSRMRSRRWRRRSVTSRPTSRR